MVPQASLLATADGGLNRRFGNFLQVYAKKFVENFSTDSTDMVPMESLVADGGYDGQLLAVELSRGC